MLQQQNFLVDSHCHLNYKGLKENVDSIINTAHMHGIKYLNNICTNKSEIISILQLSAKYKNVYCCIGIHPEHAKTDYMTSKELQDISNNNKVIGLGETGLDYFHTTDTKKYQIQSFEEHLDAAVRLNLPVIIHSRSAEDDTYNILKNHPGITGVLHCFTSEFWLAERAMELGIYISFSGICTFKNAQSVQESVKKTPLDNMLIETDAPFLAPIPMRGKINQPSYVQYVAQKIAELKLVSKEEVAIKTSTNFLKLFNKVKN